MAAINYIYVAAFLRAVNNVCAYVLVWVCVPWPLFFSFHCPLMKMVTSLVLCSLNVMHVRTKRFLMSAAILCVGCIAEMMKYLHEEELDGPQIL